MVRRSQRCFRSLASKSTPSARAQRVQQRGNLPGRERPFTEEVSLKSPVLAQTHSWRAPTRPCLLATSFSGAALPIEQYPQCPWRQPACRSLFHHASIAAWECFECLTGYSGSGPAPYRFSPALHAARGSSLPPQMPEPSFGMDHTTRPGSRPAMGYRRAVRGD